MNCFSRGLNQTPFTVPLQAYKMRPSSAVQIAKIISVAVIVSSLIIGSFILASSYIQARAACDQMQALDDMLGKELMLETLQVRKGMMTTHLKALRARHLKHMTRVRQR